MTEEILKLEKEIRYLKNNLDTIGENIKPRLIEEIANMEFDLNYMRRAKQLNSAIPIKRHKEDRSGTLALAL